MFLKLEHQKLEVFYSAQEFTVQCYLITRSFPADEKFNLVQQIRRAAVSVVLNIAEGCSRSSRLERKRYFEISRGSLKEIDAAFDIASKLNYLQGVDCNLINKSINKTFSMLSKLIQIVDSTKVPREP